MKKILVADDEPMILKALEFRLKRDGYHVITAVDGKEAMDKISSEAPDLIVTDIMMPYHTGLEIITHVKASGKSCPVIILSSVGLEQKVVEAFRLGADDFVTKPFSPNELTLRISKLLK